MRPMASGKGCAKDKIKDKQMKSFICLSGTHLGPMVHTRVGAKRGMGNWEELAV